MRAVIQRVSSGSVTIDTVEKRFIKQGFVVLLGICNEDTDLDIEWLVKKIVAMRLFSDKEGKINESLKDIDGEILLISQFTLFASTRKGNRPSFNGAGDPNYAMLLYKKTIDTFEKYLEKPIVTGEFGRDMQVNIQNDGPVTILLDSKLRE